MERPLRRGKRGGDVNEYQWKQGGGVKVIPRSRSRIIWHNMTCRAIL